MSLCVFTANIAIWNIFHLAFFLNDHLDFCEIQIPGHCPPAGEQWSSYNMCHPRGKGETLHWTSSTNEQKLLNEINMISIPPSRLPFGMLA